MTDYKIALNSQRRPNRGRAQESSLEDYNRLTHEPWLVEMIDEIRNGRDEVKSELPFRCAHYYRFKDGHRTQVAADPEAFLYQTTIDVDETELVEEAIARAQLIDNDENSPWHGMLRHIEYSARKKAHIDIALPLGMTISEAQQAYCDALGVPYDQSCVSPERILYVTDYRQELYRHPEWYKVYEGDELAERQEAYKARGLTVDGNLPYPTQKKVKSVAQPLQTTERCVEAALPSSLKAFDLCVKEAGLDVDKMDVWGEHNWHANLLAVLSTGVGKLMPKEQLEAVVAKRLGNYSKYADCHRLIADFYERYDASRGFMSASLREINAKAQDDGCKAVGTECEKDNVMDALTTDWQPPVMPKKLPRLVELEIRDYDARYHEPLAQTSVVGHSGIASHFRARYINNKVLTPSTMVSVIGQSGSGKDYCTQLFNAQMRHTLDESDNKEWEKVRANAEMRDKMKNAKECPPKYHPKIRLFESASKTSLLDLQTNLGENGMLVGLFSEADGFVGSSQAAWSNISVMLRKGFSGEKHRQYYMSESTCNTNTQLNISLLMEGTPKAILERMFNDRNCENGLMQRFMPVLMPKAKRTFRPPMQEFLSMDERKERDDLLMQLYQKDLALGDSTLVLETPKTNAAIGQWFDHLEELYTDGKLTEAEADLSHRCGEFILRAAIPLVALYGETKEVIDFSLWIGEMAFYNMCRIYGHRVQQDIITSNELLTVRTDLRKTAEPLLNKLPTTFTLKDFKDLRQQEGQSPDVKMLISRYCKSGKLVRIARGVYRKGNVPDPNSQR